MSRRLLIALALAASTAYAQPTEAPWSKGVTSAQKATAQQHLERGNALLLESKAREAVVEYEQALVAWDHPAIRFNLAKALIALDKILAANTELDKALAYGAAPLEDQVYREALTYQRLLRGQISVLDVACTQAGVVLKIDGAVTLTCPGRRELRVLPGTHVVVGTGTGLLPETRDVVATGGGTMSVAIELRTTREGARRWAAWKPWAVTAAGVSLVATGVTFNLLARDTDGTLEAKTTQLCGVNGCSTEEYRDHGLAALEDKVRLRNSVSLITLGVGGATMLVGGVMVLLNRPRLLAVERATVLTPEGGGIGIAISGRM